jgi:S-adenosylmethionine hydrolase
MGRIARQQARSCKQEARYTSGMPQPIYLMTDFGWAGPYVGQLHAAVLAESDTVRVIDVMHDLPAMRPDLAAYLLPRICGQLSLPGVVVAVVDPGVGGDRHPLVIETAAHTYVGPDNGLFSQLPDVVSVSRIDWHPRQLSASFHGRDLFAPVAARIATGFPSALTPVSADMLLGVDWPHSSACILYIDAYGNAITGIVSEGIDITKEMFVAGHSPRYAETFCRVGRGELFWYCNSQGLVEISAREASAAKILSLALGDRILLH